MNVEHVRLVLYFAEDIRYFSDVKLTTQVFNKLEGCARTQKSRGSSNTLRTPALTDVAITLNYILRF